MDFELVVNVDDVETFYAVGMHAMQKIFVGLRNSFYVFAFQQM